MCTCTAYRTAVDYIRVNNVLGMAHVRVVQVTTANATIVCFVFFVQKIHYFTNYYYNYYTTKLLTIIYQLLINF